MFRSFRWWLCFAVVVGLMLARGTSLGQGFLNPSGNIVSSTAFEVAQVEEVRPEAALDERVKPTLHHRIIAGPTISTRDDVFSLGAGAGYANEIVDLSATYVSSDIDGASDNLSTVQTEFRVRPVGYREQVCALSSDDCALCPGGSWKLNRGGVDCSKCNCRSVVSFATSLFGNFGYVEDTTHRWGAGTALELAFYEFALQSNLGWLRGDPKGSEAEDDLRAVLGGAFRPTETVELGGNYAFKNDVDDDRWQLFFAYRLSANLRMFISGGENETVSASLQTFFDPVPALKRILRRPGES